ncbi:enzymatic polyprotein, partial [Trifolium medium]|nr:enzymatic polyprotein [Trifolium medium]
WKGNKPYNRPQNNRGSNRSVNQGTRGNPVREKQNCFRCGEEGHYANECGIPNFNCHNCQKTGHFARDCKAPRVEPSANANQGARPTAKGRVYCMGTEVSGQASNAIHEDCQIAGNTLTALIDTEATHSFISLDCAHRLKLIVSPLPFDLNVSTPARDLVVNIA